MVMEIEPLSPQEMLVQATEFYSVVFFVYSVRLCVFVFNHQKEYTTPLLNILTVINSTSELLFTFGK